MRKLFAAPFVLTAALAHADKPKLPVATHPERVQKGADGRCLEYQSSECPPNVHCNPGPPQEVQCPPDKPKTK